MAAGAVSRAFGVVAASCGPEMMYAGPMHRRAFLAGGLVLLLAAPPAGAGKVAVTVYKEPT